MTAPTPGQSARTPGQAAYEAFYADTECGAPVPWAQLTDWDEHWKRAAQAALEAGAPKCPNGCGCRLGTEQADQRDCACDGLCCYDEIEVSEVFAERDRLRAAAQERPAPVMTPGQQTAAGVGTVRHAPTGATWITWPEGRQPPWELVGEAVGRLTGGAVKVRATRDDADEPGRLTVAVYRDLPELEDE